MRLFFSAAPEDLTDFAEYKQTAISAVTFPPGFFFSRHVADFVTDLDRRRGRMVTITSEVGDDSTEKLHELFIRKKTTSLFMYRSDGTFRIGVALVGAELNARRWRRLKRPEPESGWAIGRHDERSAAIRIHGPRVARGK